MEPSVAIITFPVFKINFVFVGKYGEDVVKLVFLIRGPELGEIIPFPVLKTNFEFPG